MSDMRAPADQAALPAAPPGSAGWPWTMVSPTPPENGAGTTAWPRVTILTPSFNQAPFLEQTIRSVLLQGYPNLEYFVLDGGSTDGSVEIIRRYAPWLTWWVSEPDAGQADALNRGFARATGEVLGWVNSDDMLLPGALAQAAHGFSEHPDAAMVYGGAEMIGDDGCSLGPAPQVRACDRHFLLFENNAIAQPAAFFRREAFQAAGGLDPRLYYTMDYDLWLKLGAIGPLVYRPQALACMRLYPQAKTGRGDCAMFEETKTVVERHGGHGLPTQMAEWLVAVVLPRALATLQRGEHTAGQADLACILAHVPAWRSPSRLAETLAGEAWRRIEAGEWSGAASLAWVSEVCRQLPVAWVAPGEVEHKALGLLYEGLAFQSYRQRRYSAVRSYAWNAGRADPHRWANRGLLSVALRSLYRRSTQAAPDRA